MTNGRLAGGRTDGGQVGRGHVPWGRPDFRGAMPEVFAASIRDLSGFAKSLG
jgi:hypothetical protein